MRRNSRLAAGVAMCAIAAACGAGAVPEAGVKMQPIDTDLGLGVELEEVKFGGPTEPIVAPDIEKVRAEIAEPTFEIPVDVPKVEVDATCATAGPFDFAELAPVTVINKSPALGFYRWYEDMTVKTTNGGQFGFSGASSKEVFGLADFSGRAPGSFGFRERKFNQLGLFASGVPLIEETRFWVIPNRGVNAPTNPQGAVPNNSDPGAGLFIELIELVVAFFEGSDLFEDENATFRSFILNFQQNPIQIMRFPVEAGHTLDSVGFDVNSGSTLRIRNRVEGTEQVDACGTKVHSYLLNGSREFEFNVASQDDPSDPSTASIERTPPIRFDWDINVATQLGGLIVREQTRTPCPEEQAATVATPSVTIAPVPSNPTAVDPPGVDPGGPDVPATYCEQIPDDVLVASQTARVMELEPSRPPES